MKRLLIESTEVFRVSRELVDGSGFIVRLWRQESKDSLLDCNNRDAIAVAEAFVKAQQHCLADDLALHLIELERMNAVEVKYVPCTWHHPKSESGVVVYKDWP